MCTHGRVEAKEYSGRRLRMWRVCLSWNIVSRDDRGKIREKRNSEHVCQRKREEWKGMGVRGGKRDVQHEISWYKMLLLIMHVVDTLLLKQWD